jgi:hypothetical protein
VTFFDYIVKYFLILVIIVGGISIAIQTIDAAYTLYSIVRCDKDTSSTFCKEFINKHGRR